jgi:hypothetical protein
MGVRKVESELAAWQAGFAKTRLRINEFSG